LRILDCGLRIVGAERRGHGALGEGLRTRLRSASYAAARRGLRTEAPSSLCELRRGTQRTEESSIGIWDTGLLSKWPSRLEDKARSV